MSPPKSVLRVYRQYLKPGLRSRALELGILPGAGAQFKI